MAIRSFATQTTEDVAAGVNSKAARRIPRTVWAVAQRKLDTLEAATTTEDLAALPGNRFKALRGNRAGRFSLRINDQYRLVFRFTTGDAYNVEITDYHDD